MKNLMLTLAALLAMTSPASQGQPINDNFAGRLPLAGTNVVVVASLDGSMEPGEPNHLGALPNAAFALVEVDGSE